jgi:hypothetical protein
VVFGAGCFFLVGFWSSISSLWSPVIT